MSPAACSWPRLFALTILVVAAGGSTPSLGAQPTPPAERPTSVEGVTVRARRPMSGIEVTARWCPERRGQAATTPPPRAIETYPQDGQVVPPGPLTLRITFDQPMNCGWSMLYDSREELCRQIGVWDVPGRRAWTMQCDFAPERAVSVRFGGVDGHGFAALSGAESAPFTIHFTTGAAPSSTAESASSSPPEQGAAGAATGRLLCPEHRLRGAGPRCRYLPADPA